MRSREHEQTSEQKYNIGSFFKDNVLILVEEGEWRRGKVWYIADKNKFYWQVQS